MRDPRLFAGIKVGQLVVLSILDIYSVRIRKKSTPYNLLVSNSNKDTLMMKLTIIINCRFERFKTQAAFIRCKISFYNKKFYNTDVV